MAERIEVELRPPRRVVVLGFDEREPRNLLYCAITYGVNRLFWIDGYLMCVEVYEEAFKREMEEGVFYVSHVCYARFPEYQKVVEVERGAQIPVVDASDMSILRAILEAVLGARHDELAPDGQAGPNRSRPRGPEGAGSGRRGRPRGPRSTPRPCSGPV